VLAYPTHEQIEQLLDDETKDKDYTVVMGNLNAVVGGVQTIRQWCLTIRKSYRYNN